MRSGIVLALAAVIVVPAVLRLRTPLLHARMPENGGWIPDVLEAEVGVPLELRLTSDDVVHGFAVGKQRTPSVDVLPGKVSTVTLLFDRPGTYTYYCTRWCGLNHWRMRGTIEVSGGTPQTEQDSLQEPLYVSLGIDLDAPRSAVATPSRKPLITLPRAQLEDKLQQYANLDFYRSHSPFGAWSVLRHDPDFVELDDGLLWNATAWIWKSQTTARDLTQGRELFAQNCAACHGTRAAGDGVFATRLAASLHITQTETSISEPMTQAPADLTDPDRMLAASPALLQGKIIRGGMGTGMPSWGPIFTDDQTWQLVAFLYSFQFEYR